MKRLTNNLENFIHRNSVAMLRISIGFIFVWFGALKLIPDASPAHDLAADTLNIFTFGLLPESFSTLLLAVMECAIGLSLIFNFKIRKTLLLLVGHMIATISPFLLFPDAVFGEEPLALTMAGQYIIKNIVIVCAALVIYSKSIRTQEKHVPVLRTVYPDQDVIESYRKSA